MWYAKDTTHTDKGTRVSLAKEAFPDSELATSSAKNALWQRKKRRKKKKKVKVFPRQLHVRGAHLYFKSSFSTTERITGVLSTTSSKGERDFVCSRRPKTSRRKVRSLFTSDIKSEMKNWIFNSTHVGEPLEGAPSLQRVRIAGLWLLPSEVENCLWSTW